MRIKNKKTIHLGMSPDDIAYMEELKNQWNLTSFAEVQHKMLELMRRRVSL